MSAAGNSVLSYRDSGGAIGSQQFTWFDRNGKVLGTAGKPAAYTANFDLSPDGSQVVLSILEAGGSASKLWLLDWQRNVTQPFTFDTAAGTGRDVIWSPDGLQVAYHRQRARQHPRHRREEVEPAWETCRCSSMVPATNGWRTGRRTAATSRTTLLFRAAPISGRSRFSGTASRSRSSRRPLPRTSRTSRSTRNGWPTARPSLACRRSM